MLAGLVLLLGCPPAGTSGSTRRRITRAPSEADFEGIELQRMEVQTSGPAAERYGVPVEHVLNDPEQTVVEALAGTQLQHEPALSRMVRELAATTIDRSNVPPSLTDGLMAWAGLVDPPPRLVLVEIAEDRQGCHRRVAPGCRDAVDSLVAQVETSLTDGEAQGFGVGVVGLDDGRTRMVVALLEHTVRLEPLPVALPRRGVSNVVGTLIGPRKGPRVEVVSPGGRWEPVPTSVSVDGRFSARVACEDGPGAYQVEVLAEGPHGPEVTANFPIYCGVDPPTAIPVVVEKLSPQVTADQIARANFLYLNEERRQRGLSPLEWDEDAAGVAHGHSQDMHDNHFVGHRSPTTGDVTARFTRAGVQGAIIRENVALGYGPKGIHDSLMNSPGHRVNILATDVTHVGIGVVVGQPETDVPGGPRPVYATQNFYKKPGAGAPVRAGELGPALRAQVDERRQQAGLATVGWDPKLDAIAQRYADTVARGRPAPKGYQEEVFALGYDGVDNHRVSSIDFDALAGLELWTDAALASKGIAVGIGVARAKDDSGAETFLAVVLVAQGEASKGR